MFVEHGVLDANANVSCECFEWQNSDASEPGRYDAMLRLIVCKSHILFDLVPGI